VIRFSFTLALKQSNADKFNWCGYGGAETTALAFDPYDNKVFIPSP